jgi:glycosyltransferase involved in cell wall biosynthesis
VSVAAGAVTLSNVNPLRAAAAQATPPAFHWRRRLARALRPRLTTPDPARRGRHTAGRADTLEARTMPADTCLVTVVIPVFNSAATLTRAASSALRQRAAPLELLIVDDGSTDATHAEAARIAQSDPRVRVIALRQNRGKPHAMNQAIAQAQGRWVAVLDADDSYADDRLAILIAAAEREAVDLVADNQFLLDAGAGQMVGTAFAPDRPDAVLSRQAFIAGSDPFAAFDHGMLKPVVRAEFIRRSGLQYRENARLSEDFLYLVEFFAAGGKAWLVSQPLYQWTQAFGTVSRQWTNTGAGAWRYDFLSAVAATTEVRNALDAAANADLIALLRRREAALRQLHWFRELCRARDAGVGVGQLLRMTVRQPSMWGFVLRRTVHAVWRGVATRNTGIVARTARVRVDGTVT